MISSTFSEFQIFLLVHKKKSCIKIMVFEMVNQSIGVLFALTEQI